MADRRTGSESLARAWLAVAMVVLLAGCKEERVFPYRTEALLTVDPGQISHGEIASWQVPVPLPAFLAVRTDDTVVVVGGCQGAILDTNGVVQARFEWQGQTATAVAAGPGGLIFVGAGRYVMAGVISKPFVAWDALGEQAQITGLAADSNQLWICDAAQRVVWRFDHEGRLLGQLPPPGAPREETFVVPSPAFAVALAADGNFWVVNPGRLQLQRHAPDGRLLDKWSKPGLTTPGFSGCCNPAFLALLPNGDLVTSEKKVSRVKIYGPDGTFLSVVVPPLALAGGEARPVAVDRAGRVLVLDGGRMRVFGRRE